MPSLSSALADDPYPHAAYLAVSGDGEVIGWARGHPGCTLVLQFFGEGSGVPGVFTLRPHNVPEGRRAPALVCHTPQGLPALARQKRGGHYLVTCTPACPAQVCLHAVYEAGLWKRLQAMAQRATAPCPAPSTSTGSAARQEPRHAPMPLLPFPLAAFRPERRAR
ncbi:hypothetical protein [Deinococcus ficus]|uniref:hypothetical protein n=1 Tax=Deinococcus ficus TaxID=317577 RepID=UPI0009FCE1B0|nr:hypothetical protein [Deinococcus ficus]